jgi:hypothetical protein
MQPGSHGNHVALVEGVVQYITSYLAPIDPYLDAVTS